MGQSEPFGRGSLFHQCCPSRKDGDRSIRNTFRLVRCTGRLLTEDRTNVWDGDGSSDQLWRPAHGKLCKVRMFRVWRFH